MPPTSDNLRGNMGDYYGLRHRIDNGEVIKLGQI